MRRIQRVKSDLTDLERTRRLKRKQRRRTRVPIVALVGYTNAGKSTLLRCLTDAEVLVQDQLFSTLDPTTRRLQLEAGHEVLITDTVGFVRKLPHQLVEAFRSTLEEVTEASILMHVVDASRDPERQISAVDTVLKEIGVTDTPVLVVMNKIDLLSDVELDKLYGRFPDAVFVSAVAEIGMDEIRRRIAVELSKIKVEVVLDVPYDRGDVVARAHQDGDVLEETYSDTGTHMVARIRRESLGEFTDFLAQTSTGSRST
jgi:GTP-binding protein HflX